MMIVRLVLACACCSLAWAGEDAISLVVPRQAFFDQQPIELNLQCPDVADGDRVSLRLVFENRTLLRREMALAPEVSLTFTFPELRPGVVADARVEARVLDVNGRELRSSQIGLFVHAREAGPLPPRLRQLRIGFLGDAGIGEMLTGWGLKAEVVRDVTAFDGDWLVLSGANFRARPGLAEALVERAAAGTQIILLPPITGDFVVAQQSLAGLELKSTDCYRHLGKQVDRVAWAADGGLSAGHLRLGERRGALTLSLVPEPGRLTMARLAVGRGALYLCGWDVLAHYRENPTPRMVFLDLFGERPKN